MQHRLRPRPVVLCILDGWGHRERARRQRHPPGEDAELAPLHGDSPHALLQASELFVGLPNGQMGNSEVGHMNIGAGRVVMQDLPRIDQAIADGTPRQEPGPGRIHRRAQEERRHGASAGAGVAGRRAFASGPYRRAGAHRSTQPACRSRSMPSSTAATRRPRAPPAISRKFAADIAGLKRVSHRHRQRPLLRHGPRQALGPRREGLSTRWSMPRARRPADAEAAIAARLCRGQDRRIRAADRRSAIIAGMQRRRRRADAPISAPTACARS